MRSVTLAAITTSLSAMLLLAGYEFVRSPVTSLVKVTYGIDKLPLIMGLSVFGVLGAVWLYGIVLTYLGPRRTLFAFSLGSGLFMGFSFWAIRAGFEWMAILLFIFKEAYVVLIIEQYWSFLNSSFDKEKAKKLNGIVLGISSTGGFLGGYFVSTMAVSWGTHSLLFFSSILTIGSAFLSDIGYRILGEPKRNQAEEMTGKSGNLGLNLFVTYPALSYLFLVIVLTQILSTVAEIQWHHWMQLTISELDLQTAFQGRFWMAINGTCLVGNFLIIPFLMKRIPLKFIHWGIPVIHMVTFILCIFWPSLILVTATFYLFKTLDYSLFRATKETLYIPYPFDVRYRAKSVIDAFGYRFGKGSALGLDLIQRAGFSFQGLLAPIGLTAAFAWFACMRAITKGEKQTLKNR